MADELDFDPILASSRRALICLADAEVLSLGNQLDAMRSAMMSGGDHMAIYETQNQIVSDLVDYFKSVQFEGSDFMHLTYMVHQRFTVIRRRS